MITSTVYTIQSQPINGVITRRGSRPAEVQFSNLHRPSRLYWEAQHTTRALYTAFITVNTVATSHFAC